MLIFIWHVIRRHTQVSESTADISASISSTFTRTTRGTPN